jgi:hypothetical protein
MSSRTPGVRIPQVEYHFSIGLCWLEHTALRREHVDVDDIWLILQEMEAGQCPKWKNIASHVPAY